MQYIRSRVIIIQYFQNNLMKENLSPQSSINHGASNNNAQPVMPQQLVAFVSLVPKHLRKYIQLGIFIIPTDKIIDNYSEKKAFYLQEISNSKQPSINSLHKYTSVNPLSPQDIDQINMKVSKNLNMYYSMYLKDLEFKEKQPKFFVGFGIVYNKGHKGLALHTDDSTYTVNLCLNNNASGNEVVFNQILAIEPIQDYALIHSGNLPHHTNNLYEGQRTNVVLWYK